MFQTLLEEESNVNGIVDAGKARFSFIELGFTGTKEILWEGEATCKWKGTGSPIIIASTVTTSSASNAIVL